LAGSIIDQDLIGENLRQNYWKGRIKKSKDNPQMKMFFARRLSPGA
jgi:hypothetical protein